MEVFGIVKEFSRLTKVVFPELSQKGLDRLRAITLWQETKDTRLMCETFGMSRATLCRRRRLFSHWVRRFDPHDLTSLQERSCRPWRGSAYLSCPPESPKHNGPVERAHRTHTEEFYEVYEVPESS
jgi:hypothetical protein